MTEYAIVPKSWMNEMSEKMDQINGTVQRKISNDWIDSNEVITILGISRRTWQTYRDEGVIPFVQFGRKIYVRRNDLNAFMEANYRTGKTVTIKRPKGVETR